MQPIRHYFSDQLVHLYEQSIMLKKLSEKIGGYLPEPLNAHCHVGSFHKGCLILMTKDASWASQLRYFLPELRDKLRKEEHMYQLTCIKISLVMPDLSQALKPKHILSEQSKNAILENSQEITYQPLQDALKRLTRTTNYPVDPPTTP